MSDNTHLTLFQPDAVTQRLLEQVEEVLRCSTDVFKEAESARVVVYHSDELLGCGERTVVAVGLEDRGITLMARPSPLCAEERSMMRTDDVLVARVYSDGQPLCASENKPHNPPEELWCVSQGARSRVLYPFLNALDVAMLWAASGNGRIYRQDDPDQAPVPFVPSA